MTTGRVTGAQASLAETIRAEGDDLVLRFGIDRAAAKEALEEPAVRKLLTEVAREAFGRPIIKFQVWRHKFVEHLTAIEAAKRLTYHAVELHDRKEEAVREISMAKLFAGDLAQKVAYDCQQFHGGMGYIEETPIARAWRDVRLITIGAGTSEIMKEIIAKLSDL